MNREINKVILQGYVGKKPEIRTTNSGITVATFSVATRPHLDPSLPSPSWHFIMAHGEKHLSLMEEIKKGSLVYLEGELYYYVWKDRFHQQRVNARVVLFPSRSILEVLPTKGQDLTPSLL